MNIELFFFLELTVSYNVNLDAEQVAAKRGFFEDNGNEVHSLKKTITVDKSEKKCAPKLTIFLKVSAIILKQLTWA